MRAARRAAVAAGLALAVAVGTLNRVEAVPQRLDREAQVPPVGLCLDIDIDALLPPLAFHLHLGLVIGNPDCAAPPPSTTTSSTTTTEPPATTTTTTTAPPPSTTTTSTTTTTTEPPPTTRTTTTTEPPATTTTTTTAPPPSTTTTTEPPASTTTTTTEPPASTTTVPATTVPELLVAPEPAPPPPESPTPRPPPAPPQLVVTATMAPPQPVAGGSFTATITVRNVGPLATPALGLTDVLQGAEVRSAGGGTAECGVVAREADCRLQSLAPGASTTLEVRLLVDRAPAPSKVTQQIRLAATDDVIVADRAVAVPLASEGGGLAGLLEGPGTAVTLGAAFGLVLSARPRSPSSRNSSR